VIAEPRRRLGNQYFIEFTRFLGRLQGIAPIFLLSNQSHRGDIGARLVLAAKPKLAAVLPGAGQIEALETDADTVLPVHPGAAAYLKGEQNTVLEQIQDSWATVVSIGGPLAPAAV
jgi:hypothetical protein